MQMKICGVQLIPNVRGNRTLSEKGKLVAGRAFFTRPEMREWASRHSFDDRKRGRHLVMLAGPFLYI